jgi:hypothetical protein
MQHELGVVMAWRCLDKYAAKQVHAGRACRVVRPPEGGDLAGFLRILIRRGGHAGRLYCI